MRPTGHRVASQAVPAGTAPPYVDQVGILFYDFEGDRIRRTRIFSERREALELLGLSD